MCLVFENLWRNFNEHSGSNAYSVIGKNIQNLTWNRWLAIHQRPFKEDNMWGRQKCGNIKLWTWKCSSFEHIKQYGTRRRRKLLEECSVSGERGKTGLLRVHPILAHQNVCKDARTPIMGQVCLMESAVFCICSKKFINQ